jgi:hypothetical protein
MIIGHALQQLIVEAIRERRRLRFRYHGSLRLAEPQCYGIGARGTELLRVHQLEGGSQREPLFDVAKMSALVVLDERFDRPGPNYKENDSAMQTIFAQLRSDRPSEHPPQQRDGVDDEGDPGDGEEQRPRLQQPGAADVDEGVGEPGEEVDGGASRRQ